MAITFLERRKLQRRYLIIFGLIILVTVLIFWRGFLVKEKPVFPGEIPEMKRVNIDFKILENPILKGLRSFEEIAPFKGAAVEEEMTGKVGRENPFLPY